MADRRRGAGAGRCGSRGRAGQGGLALLSLLTVCAWPLASAAEQAGTEVEIDSATVELDREQGEVAFRGNVVLRHGDLSLRCDQLIAHLGEGGELVSIEAEGGVTIRTAGFHAAAGAASYIFGTRRLVLSGRPSVTSAAGTLRGRQVIVDLRTGRVSIEQAHGVFRLP